MIRVVTLTREMVVVQSDVRNMKPIHEVRLTNAVYYVEAAGMFMCFSGFILLIISYFCCDKH